MMQSKAWFSAFRSPLACLCIVAGAAVCAVPPTPTFAQEDKTVVEDPEKLFEPREFVGANGKSLKYRLLKPAPYDANREYPLVIFLHGAGERGSDNKAQLKHGMADFCKTKWRDKYPCYVVAPQCPEGEKWVDVDWSKPADDMPAKTSDSMQLVFELLDTMVKDSAVNDNRIYITGLSMGGYGTWDALARRPSFFAAAIPICGGGDPKTAARFANVPLWCFHGDQDKAVPVKRSREMIEALKAAGGTPKYTEYPGVEHNSWAQTYADPAVFEWLFTQLRRDTVETTAEQKQPAKPSDQ
jgi:predicted peptidase